jgi:transcriptional regulator with XRE-family HTH domain
MDTSTADSTVAAAPQRGAAAQLNALGACLRARRKALRISAVDAAQASAMSRVTLHRVERGEASVSMASYMNAIASLGLELSVAEPRPSRGSLPTSKAATELTLTLRLADYAQLQTVAWHIHGTAWGTAGGKVSDQKNDGVYITPEMALSLYERNWRHLDHAAMSPEERALVARLARDLPGGRLLV